MRLIYNDNTPNDYEPPGFKSCNFEKYKYDQGKCRIRIGDVNCLWHQVCMEINCSNIMLKKDEFNENMDASATQKKELSETVDLVPINVSVESNISKTENPEDSITNKIGDLNFQSSSIYQSPKILKINKIQCICGSEQDNNMKLIKCSICDTYQHAICYNIFCDQEFSDSDWEKKFVQCCLDCYQKDQSLKTTDESLTRMDKKKLTGISLWRKALFELKKMNLDQVYSSELMKILSLKQNIMKGLIKKLEDGNFLLCNNKKE